MIGGTLEYLMNSLPHLSFQDTSEVRDRVLGLLQKYKGDTVEELSPVEVLEKEAQKFLPASRFDAFREIDLKNIHRAAFQKDKSKVVSAFAKFDLNLKKDIRAWQISQNDKEKKVVKNKLEKMIGEGNPLEKEIQIMKYQWDKLEDLSTDHFADFEALITYKLKLLILLRWWSFNQEKGLERFIQMTTNN